MSPIEKKFYDALVASIPDEVTLCDFVSGNEWQDRNAKHVVALHAQAKVHTYVADFMLTVKDALRLVIECDGHDWHERTKQQAAYDRARDRELLSRFVFTVRFTGSEIHHSAERCAADAWRVLGLLFQMLDDMRRTWSAGHAAGVRDAEQLSLGAQRDAWDDGFSDGLRHAARAFSVEFNDLHTEEHY